MSEPRLMGTSLWQTPLSASGESVVVPATYKHCILTSYKQKPLLIGHINVLSVAVLTLAGSSEIAGQERRKVEEVTLDHLPPCKRPLSSTFLWCRLLYSTVKQKDRANRVGALKSLLGVLNVLEP